MKIIDEEQRLSQIAARIKQLRLDTGSTSYENFAVEHGLDRKQYWRLENAKNFTVTSLFRILDIHGITLSEFFSDLK